MDFQCDLISGGCNAVYSGISFCHDKRYSSLVVYACANQVFVYDSQKVKVICTLSQFEKRVNSVKFFTYNDKLKIAAVSGDGIISQWVYQEGEWIYELQAQITVQKLQQFKVIVENDGKVFFVLLGTDGLVYIIDQDLKKITSIEYGNNVMESVDVIEFQGAIIIAFSGQDKGIHIYEFTKNQLEFKCSLKGHQRSVNTLSFQKLKDKLLLASGGKDNYIRIWQLQVANHEFSEIDQKKGFKKFYQIGKYSIWTYRRSFKVYINIKQQINLIVFVGLIKKTFQLRNANQNYILHHLIIILQFGNKIKNLVFGQSNPDLVKFKEIKTNFLGLVLQLIVLWNQQLIENPTITGHYSSVTDLDVSKNGYIVSCSLDQTTRVWSHSYNNIWHEISRPQVHGYDINAIKFLHRKDNFFETLVSGGDEKVIRLFTPTPMSANFLRVISSSSCVLPQGELIQQNNHKIYKVGQEGVSQPLGLMNKQMVHIPDENEEFLQQDETIETQIDLTKIQFDIPPTHQLLNARGLWPELNKLYGHGYELLALATYQNLIASSCKSTSEDSAQIILWDASNFKLLGFLRSHQSSVVQMQFSSSGQYLVSTSKDRTVSLFKRNDQLYDLVARSAQSARIVYTCAIDPLERFIVTGSRDKKFRVYSMNLDKIFEKNLGTPVTASEITKLPNEFYLLILGFENGNIIFYTLEYTENIVNLIQLEKMPQNYKHNQQINRIKIIKTNGFQVQFCSCSEDHTVRIFTVNIHQ